MGDSMIMRFAALLVLSAVLLVVTAEGTEEVSMLDGATEHAIVSSSASLNYAKQAAKLKCPKGKLAYTPKSPAKGGKAPILKNLYPHLEVAWEANCVDKLVSCAYHAA